MSEQNAAKNTGEWLSQMPFTKLFCFRTAIMPGKLGLALFGLIVIFLAGFLMDRTLPSRMKVVTDKSGVSEVEAFVAGRWPETGAFKNYRQQLVRENEDQLKALLISPMNYDSQKAGDSILSGEAVEKIRQEYQKKLSESLTLLSDRYRIRQRGINSELENAPDRQQDMQAEQQRRLKELDIAYQSAIGALMGEKETLIPAADAVNQVIELDTRMTGGSLQKEMVEDLPKYREQVMATIQYGRAYQAAKVIEPRGIFATLVDFSAGRFRTAVSALVWSQDLAVVKAQIHDVLKADCWLMRCHPVYGVILVLIKLVVISIIGGAICRIAALQYTRDERIGPMQALRFSLSRFGGFFTAPLIPAALIAVICGLMFVSGIVAAIPGVGSVLSGLLMGLGIIGGFVAALVSVGLIGGFNLMFPTIAVEGSDSFDAVSRSFSYVLSRPWRMGLYTGISAIYGAICYLFVRFFALLILLILHVSVQGFFQQTGFGKSAMIPTRGTIEAIWPTPSFAELLPAHNWMTLSGAESVGSMFVLIWVGLVAGIVISFLVSFYFSSNTMIYLLLRNRVDSTDFEDVYLEESVSDLIAEEGQPSEAGAQAGATSAAESQATQSPTSGGGTV